MQRILENHVFLSFRSIDIDHYLYHNKSQLNFSKLVAMM